MAKGTTTKERERLTAITRIHRSVGASLNMEEVSRIVVRELTGGLSSEGCAIFLVEGEKIRALAERGLPETNGNGDFYASVPIRHVVDAREAILTSDVERSAVAGSFPPGRAVKSLLCVPVLVNGEVRGVIYLDSLKEKAFNEKDLELMEFLADEMSITIERTFIYSRVVDSSIRDGLTGCFNRRKFDVDVVAGIALAKQRRGPISLLVVEVDCFQSYSDFHGQTEGDLLLRKVAATLIYNIRPLDRAYRYGGEKFAVLLPETERGRAFLVARRLQRAVELASFDGEERSQPGGKVTVSTGFAGFPEDASDRDALVQAAELALSRASQSGGNRACGFRAGE